jgi:hypothetical protein
MKNLVPKIPEHVLLLSRQRLQNLALRVQKAQAQNKLDPQAPKAAAFKSPFFQRFMSCLAASKTCAAIQATAALHPFPDVQFIAI